MRAAGDACLVTSWKWWKCRLSSRWHCVCKAEQFGLAPPPPRPPSISLDVPRRLHLFFILDYVFARSTARHTADDGLWLYDGNLIPRLRNSKSVAGNAAHGDLDPLEEVALSISSTEGARRPCDAT